MTVPDVAHRKPGQPSNAVQFINPDNASDFPIVKYVQPCTTTLDGVSPAKILQPQAAGADAEIILDNINICVVTLVPLAEV